MYKKSEIKKLIDEAVKKKDYKLSIIAISMIIFNDYIQDINKKKKQLM